MKIRIWLASLAVAAFAVSVSLTAPGSGKKELAFGALEPMSDKEAQAKAQAWLKEVGKTDAATTQKFQTIWSDETKSVLDRLADSFALGNAQAAKMLNEARAPFALAPTKVPDLLSDKETSLFVRSNLGLAYARVLSSRKFHDEALAVLKLFQAEQVAAPATFLFTRAVCEHALLQKDLANRTIVRLLEEGVSTPERYKTVSVLMLVDMQAWKEKDLAAIARKMKVVEDRLEIAKGGPETQKIQKQIIDRLEELIKEEENKAKSKSKGDPKPGDGPPKPGDGPPNGGSCPDGGSPGNQPGDKPGDNPGEAKNEPMKDSKLGGPGGKGTVDLAEYRRMVDGWGRMQPREQAQAIQRLTRGMSPKHREAIENYFRNLASPPAEIRAPGGR